MKTKPRSPFFCLLVLGYFAAGSVLASGCDEIQVLDNEQGRLSLEGYTFGVEPGNMRTLRAPTSPLGFCESGVVISAPGTRLPVEYQDDRVTRLLSPDGDFVVDWDTGKLAPGFATRFQIEPELTKVSLPADASLTFRRLVFSPPYSPGTNVNLDFTVDAMGSADKWLLRAHITSPENGIVEDVELGVVGPDFGSARRLEVYFEYVYSQVPGESKIRISKRAKGRDHVVWEKRLVGMMFITRQVQGLVEIHGIDQDRKFTILNCMPLLCAKSLDEE